MEVENAATPRVVVATAIASVAWGNNFILVLLDGWKDEQTGRRARERTRQEVGCIWLCFKDEFVLSFLACCGVVFASTCTYGYRIPYVGPTMMRWSTAWRRAVISGILIFTLPWAFHLALYELSMILTDDSPVVKMRGGGRGYWFSLALACLPRFADPPCEGTGTYTVYCTGSQKTQPATRSTETRSTGVPCIN